MAIKFTFSLPPTIKIDVLWRPLLVYSYCIWCLPTPTYILLTPCFVWMDGANEGSLGADAPTQLERQIRFLLTANSQHLCLRRHLSILMHKGLSQLFFIPLST